MPADDIRSRGSGEAREVLQFQQEQRATWDSVASAWRTWWRIFERGTPALNQRLCDLAGIAEGHRVLDVATGLGEPALTAARRVGERGRVCATDLSPGMLAIASQRAAQARLENIEFHELDAHEIGRLQGPFDAATCRFGLMLMLEPGAVASSIRGVVRPGGRFACAVWARPERAPFLSIPRVCAERLLGPLAAPDDPGPFRLCEQALLEPVLEAGGWKDLKFETERVTMEFQSAHEYAQATEELSSSLRKRLDALDSAMRRKLLESITAAAAEHVDRDGLVRMHNEVLCGVGSA